MSIDFSMERWQQVKENYRRWWRGELDRPLIQFRVSDRDPGRPQPKLPAYDFTAFYDLSVSANAIVDRWDYDLSRQRFLGDAFPCVWPNFGPGVIAALLGCQLRADGKTCWFHPVKEEELANLRFQYDPDNIWLRRIKDLGRAALERWEGLVQVGTTDLGGNLDILSSFRPSEQLLLDLYDHPADVKTRTWEAHALWWRYFEEFNRVYQPRNPGYTAWTPIFAESPYYMLQCDFCYMIGPEMFDEFVKPELAASCRRLSNPFYHLDGVGELPHLDSLLTIPELKGIQWIPGDGKPGVAEWPEVYRRIRAAGKLIQLFGPLANLDAVARQIGTYRGIILIGGSNKLSEIEAGLRRYRVTN